MKTILIVAAVIAVAWWLSAGTPAGSGYYPYMGKAGGAGPGQVGSGGRSPGQ